MKTLLIFRRFFAFYSMLGVIPVLLTSGKLQLIFFAFTINLFNSIYYLFYKILN